MLKLVNDETNPTHTSFTLGYERTDSGFLKFRFEFRPRPDLWLDSEWFVPSTSQVDVIRSINYLWQAKVSWDLRLREAGLDVRRFFTEFNKRIPSEDHIAYRYGEKSLSDLSPLDSAYIVWGKAMDSAKKQLQAL